MTGELLLLVGAGKMGADYLRAGRERGARLRVAEFPAFVERTSQVAERVEVPATMLEESWYAAALRALDGERPGAVVAFSEPHVLGAALLQEMFGVPGPGLHAAVVSRDKALQRAVFDDAGVPQPEWTLVSDVRDATGWAADRFPVVVKPVGESGSIGVALVADAAGWDATVTDRTGRGRVLVEEAVDGPEFSVECLVRDGMVLFSNVTAKETTGPPHFVEACHRPGRQFDPDDRETVDGFVRTVLSALRMRTGIAHLEFRAVARPSPRGRPWVPVLMEVAVRTPGDYIMEAVSMTWGTDLFGGVVDLALGRDPLVPPPGSVPGAAAASAFLFLDRAGVVRAVEGVDLVRAHPHVVRCTVNYAPGDRVDRATSSMNRAGHVLVAAPDARARDDALAFARDRIRFDVR
jgi:biotin carboxylase